jgi:hypothetical protein
MESKIPGSLADASFARGLLIASKAAKRIHRLRCGFQSGKSADTAGGGLWSSRISWSSSARPFNATATRVVLNHLIESKKLACPETGIARGAAAHDVCSVAPLDGVADIHDGNHAGKLGRSLLSSNTVLGTRGDCRVPKRYNTNDGYRLGSWIGNQRSNKDRMSAERRQCL